MCRGGVFDDHPVDLDRCERGARGQHPGAANFHLDAEQGRCHLAGREFESHRPARILADKTELRRQRKIIELDDHPVGFVAQLVATFVPGFGVGDGFVDAVKAPGHVRDRETERLQPLEQFPL